jgi:hypothetical protein
MFGGDAVAGILFWARLVVSAGKSQEQFTFQSASGAP